MSKISYELMMKMLRIKRYEKIAEYDNVVNLGIDTMWKDLCAQTASADVDPTEIFAEEMNDLQDVMYSMKLMNICCLSETWEQDLYNYLKEKGLITTNSNDYGNTKRIFEQAYPTCPISNYPKIGEMRALVNAIKHGEGNALATIRRMTSDAILADSNWGVVDANGGVCRKKQIEFDCNTLTSRTLNVEGKLKMYSETIIEFWESVYAAEQEKQEMIEL